ncbi:protein of unknown function [Candidatus Nitrospira inopinata]|uniref:Uncharacterized protein n=1 Tax=Candidatus Nitrospira inopinata TaxID=1715989 RepID=A0A0S4KXP9_9BACT|nr:protein of unknown function [Candidatus Nitrospira inopinata]
MELVKDAVKEHRGAYVLGITAAKGMRL